MRSYWKCVCLKRKSIDLVTGLLSKEILQWTLNSVSQTREVFNTRIRLGPPDQDPVVERADNSIQQFYSAVYSSC